MWFIIRELHTHVLLDSLISFRMLGTNVAETFSLRPSWGASTVINKPLIPRASACCTSFFVISLSLLTYLKVVSIDYTQWCGLAPTIDRIALVQEVMRPLFRQKHMKQVSESDRPDGVSKCELHRSEETNHLDNTVFRCRLRKVQLSVWMAEFPKRCRRLRVALQCGPQWRSVPQARTM